MATKKGLTAIIILALVVPTTSAALVELPSNYMDGWGGTSPFATAAGIVGRIEFGVYDTQVAGGLAFSSPGNRRYVYAYQIFTNQNSLTAVDYFMLTGINPSGIADAQDIDTYDTPGGVGVSEDPYYTLAKTEAIFRFQDGVLIQGANSVILLLGSDATPIIGGYSFVPPQDGTAPVPGEIPEPATIALLMGGALLSLRKRK